MKLLTIGVVCVLLCAGGTSVHAQEIASSFEQLAVLVKPGDKITLVDATGLETNGRIGKLSADALILVTSSGSRQLGEMDVAAYHPASRRFAQKWGDHRRIGRNRILRNRGGALRGHRRWRGDHPHCDCGRRVVRRTGCGSRGGDRCVDFGPAGDFIRSPPAGAPSAFHRCSATDVKAPQSG